MASYEMFVCFLVLAMTFSFALAMPGGDKCGGGGLLGGLGGLL